MQIHHIALIIVLESHFLCVLGAGGFWNECSVDASWRDSSCHMPSWLCLW